MDDMKMTEITFIEGGVCAPKGFLASGLHCGIRKNKSKRDLALIYSQERCAAASVYTQNKVKGAPILITRQNLADGRAQAIICNSGNANTCNADGVDKAQATCDALAKALGIDHADVIVASTGVIGQPLPLEPIINAIPELAKQLSTNGSKDAAEGIMTTDTIEKQFGVSFTLGGCECRLGGMAKGSGMIHPNMATMLGFITTDAAIAPELLHSALLECVAESFNMVSVDGDTSTNDMVSVLANGVAGNPEITQFDDSYKQFKAALMSVCVSLSRAVAKDGEGASKLLECTVTGSPTRDTARVVAKSVITSSLFKAAMFGEDANWGRVLCAIGYAEAEFDIEQVGVVFTSEGGCVEVCRGGSGVEFSEELAKKVLGCPEIKIKIDLGQGVYSAVAWGCDLTYDYVKINGDYRT